jgi:hypothetical protein
VSLDDGVVVEIFGEGRTDIGRNGGSQRPTTGVVPILMHRLCGRPETMRVKRTGIPFLHNVGGRGLHRKVTAARKLAQQNRSDAAVFVMDSEGDLDGTRGELSKGRDLGPSSVPMAIGVAHPCIESWLLTDASAIQRALGLGQVPEVPDEPEALPAPNQNRKRNPKTELAGIAASRKRELSAEQKERIASAMSDMGLLRTRCPLGFAPFADEVEEQIHPLF